MNMTIHIFLERAWAGVTVFNHIPEGVIALQDEVRQAFGWPVDADALSANEMSNQFMGKAPYGQV